MVTGDKAPDYDTLIKRDRLRMDNLLKKKKKKSFTQTTRWLRKDNSTFTN